LNQSTAFMSSAIVVSVIIPHLNQPEGLRACLESLARQAFDQRRVEIIVVDNGSRQPPVDVCSGFEGVRLLDEPLPGPGPARNRGVCASRGEFLAFIDADCTADPGWLAAIVAALTPRSGPGSSMVIGGDVRIARRDPGRATMLEAYESVYAYRQEDYIARQGFSGTGNLAMARQVYDAVGPFCGVERAEDRDWGQRATRAGYSIRYVPDMIVYHPARQSFAELCTKWDRHVSHDFATAAPGLAGRLRWLARAAAVAASPLLEAPRLLASRRVETSRERLLAAGVLVRIRLYRAGCMLSALRGGTGTQASRQWNRSPDAAVEAQHALDLGLPQPDLGDAQPRPLSHRLQQRTIGGDPPDGGRQISGKLFGIAHGHPDATCVGDDVARAANVGRDDG
jgi:GT2 family glycosyltransferase